MSDGSAGWLASAALIFLAGLASAAKTAPDPFKPVNPLPCDCSDVDPRSYFTKADVQFSCLEQAQYGQCEMPFMTETQEEISEGYCQISCGRCSCCKSLAEVLEERGFYAFLWLLSNTDAGPLVAEPGYMATLIAPHDSAVDEAIYSLTGSSSREEALEKGKDKLERLARLHIIPPVPITRAVYTHPFFTTGLKLPTALAYPGQEAVTLDVRRTDDDKVELKSKSSSGWIYEADIYACKGYVQAIGSALLP